MKGTLISLTVIALCGSMAWHFGRQREADVRAAELSRQQALWHAEKLRLEASLKRSRQRAPEIITLEGETVVERVTETRELSPTEIIEQLQRLSISPAARTESVRRIIQQLENLVDTGPRALPPVSDFLKRFQDIDYQLAGPPVAVDTSEPPPIKLPPPGKILDGKGRIENILAPSLRLALFDAVRRIGGPDAEQILADGLKTTGRGVEVFYLSRMLEQIAPGAFRDAAVNAARELLARPVNEEQGKGADHRDREYLLAVLSFYRDPVLFAQMQAQLVSPEGQVNSEALRFLKENMGADALPGIFQAIENPRIADPKQKERLIEFALNFVGADDRVNELFAQVVVSEAFSEKLREQSIKHLRAEGLENEKTPTLRDLKVLEARLNTLDAIRPGIQSEGVMQEWSKTRGRIVEQLSGVKVSKPEKTKLPDSR